ncbi:hypothetical protein OS188_12375 [Xanthomarina sp. F1114]|uniref:hypothetical protein n=1 Tax=Xanthomarina sp. F1114 TaxID=2996019 RepID=UPI00225E46EF|nr:hypothetical protein [Xanthomarina sp. F1114]MCX7548749.1 hypothetical protein [Xanthomarina sp. F1114]
MDLNLLFSVVLCSTIGILILLSIKTIIATKWDAKMFQEKLLNLQEQFAQENVKQEQVIQKNVYLENYNKSLLNQLFEITKELLITKKIIFEEHYN